MFCAEGGDSLSETEEEVSCERFCGIGGADGSAGLAKGDSFAFSVVASSASISSSSELEESGSSKGG